MLDDILTYRHQFLSQQFHRIRRADLLAVDLVVPQSEVVGIADGHQPGLPVDVHREQVAGVHELLLHKRGGAVRDQAVALHLSDPTAPVARAPLGWLPSQWLRRPGAPAAGNRNVSACLFGG